VLASSDCFRNLSPQSSFSTRDSLLTVPGVLDSICVEFCHGRDEDLVVFGVGGVSEAGWSTMAGEVSTYCRIRHDILVFSSL
jgi:hypothetical protein